jgi:cytochrome b561
MQIEKTPMTNNLRNSQQQYGWVSIVLHWSLAIALIAMYFAGDYMVDLDYYDTWYHRLPQIHKEVGVVIGALMIFRLLWNALQTSPEHVGDDGPKIQFMAKAAHYFLYGLVFMLVISGYLISTAKGQGIDVFGLFELPAFLPDNKDRGELAGDVHEWIGLGFIALVALHALAALLHHFFYKDRTLKRMLTVKKAK